MYPKLIDRETLLFSRTRSMNNKKRIKPKSKRYKTQRCFSQSGLENKITNF